VTIGDPGNPSDTTGSPNPAGSVNYVYRIGKYEINRDMIEKANREGGLGIPLANMFEGNGPNRPASGISWFAAARFANWLNSSSGHPAAYKFNDGGFELWQPGDLGFDAANRFRNGLAHYFLPSADEWYKAAYYDSQSGVYFDFPTGSDTAPTPVAGGTVTGTAVYGQSRSAFPAEIMQAGGLSPYGTMAQGGNVFEWEETEYDLVNDDPLAHRGERGGDWGYGSDILAASFRSGFFPTNDDINNGFRVASIPEPSSLLIALGLPVAVMYQSRKEAVRA
jgi:formylglycine-generating enzyme required for sulfatase activity